MTTGIRILVGAAALLVAPLLHAGFIEKDVTLVIGGNRIDVFGYAQYINAAGEPVAARVSGNITLFDGPFQMDTPYVADYVPFIEYSGNATPEIRYDGTEAWCYAGSITAEAPDVPRTTKYTDGGCTRPPAIYRDPHPVSLCPLVLDLDGGGIQTTGAEAPVTFFDSNFDGHRELSGWTSGGREDAFLWMDVDKNGSVQPGELFGSGMKLPSGLIATNGFQALEAYDLHANGGDANGVIDRHDEIWSKLRLWVDRNHDGCSDNTEIAPPGSEQILEFGLDRMRTHNEYQNGNSVMLRGSFMKMFFPGHGAPVPVERQLLDIAFLPVEP